jgi:hypothetical protein
MNIAFMKQAARVSPFLLTGIILIYTWYIILTTEYFATTRHVIALILFGINALLYFLRFRYAILLTGVILILATLNLLAFFPDITSTSYFVKIGNVEIGTPSIQWQPLLILIFYCIVNFSFFVDVYVEYKDKKRVK